MWILSAFERLSFYLLVRIYLAFIDTLSGKTLLGRLHADSHAQIHMMLFKMNVER